MTGFFFDTNTSYYFIFDAPSQRFLFYDYKVKTYRVYPPESTSESAKPVFLAPAALVNPDVDAQPSSGEAAAAAAAAAVAIAPQEYKKGAKPLKMTLTAKKAATNMAQWNRMKEIDTEAPPATLDAFVKATEEDDAAVEAEVAQRRVRNTGRAPVADVQPRPMSAQYSSLGRGPKNPHCGRCAVCAERSDGGAASARHDDVSNRTDVDGDTSHHNINARRCR
jgi:hypothetical protein